MLHRKLAILGLAATVAALGTSSAAAGPAWEFTTAGNTYTNGNWDFGTWFTAKNSVTVTGLGYYADPITTQANNNQVGLFNSSGALLASATVNNTYALFGHFRYVTITPLVLTAGETYQVAGVSQSNNYTWNDSGFATDADITYLGNTWAIDTDNTPTFLNFYQNDQTDGYWGPNLFLSTRDFTGDVPEPGTLALAGLLLAGLGATRRARSKQADV